MHRSWQLVAVALAVLTTGGSSEARRFSPPGTEMRKLTSALLGSWKYEAEFTGMDGVVQKFSGTDVYEPGPGGYSLSHQVKESGFSMLAIFSYDTRRKTYAYVEYDSEGDIGDGIASWKDGSILSSGHTTTVQGAERWNRCVWKFQNPSAFTIRCDHSTDQKKWVSDLVSRVTRAR